MAIRIGVIGAGRVGRAHLETLASFGATPHINFRTLLTSLGQVCTPKQDKEV